MLMPFFIGFAIAYMVNILIGKIEELIISKIKKVTRISERSYKTLVAFVYIITLIIFVGASFIIIPSIIESIENIVAQLLNIDVVKLSNDTSNFIFKFTGKEYELNDLIAYATEQIATLLNSLKDIIPYIMGATKQVFGIFINFLLGIIVSIYMSLNKNKYLDGVQKASMAYLGSERTNKISTLAHKINSSFKGFISTVLIGAIIVSSITLIVTKIMGISNAPLIAFVIAIGNLVPFFGPILGLLSAIILVFISTPDKVVMYIIFAILLQQFDANVLNPKIVGNKLGLDALLVIFAVIVMSGLFGFIGTLVGVPAFAVIYYLIKESVTKRLYDKTSVVPLIENDDN